MVVRAGPKMKVLGLSSNLGNLLKIFFCNVFVYFYNNLNMDVDGVPPPKVKKFYRKAIEDAQRFYLFARM